MDKKFQIFNEIYASVAYWFLNVLHKVKKLL